MTSKHPIYIYVAIILGGVVALLSGCHPFGTIGPLESNKTDFQNVAAEGDTLKVIISSDRKFVPVTETDWLSANLPTGRSRNKVTINVRPNLSDKERVGEIAFVIAEDEEGEKDKVSITVHQRGRDQSFAIDSVMYEIPLIFHVITNPEDIAKKDAQNNDNDPNNDYTKVTGSSLQKLVEQVNQLYSGNPPYPKAMMKGKEYNRAGLTNSRIRFVLATKDPDGKRLSPSGITSHDMTERALDPAAVMQDKKGGTYHSMSYPISRYINVYVFPFKHGKDVGQITLGSSHLPYLVTEHKLEGLGTWDRVIKGFDNYNHCIVLNYQQFENRVKETQSISRIHETLTPAAVTLAHELGHYLGLGHVFAEKKSEGETSVLQLTEECIDSDFVDDTPSYNRIAYNRVMSEQIAALESSQGSTAQSVLTSLLARDLCDGRFNQTSFNLMDYEVSYNDRFTPGQISRMRQVLYYSLTVPGDKLVSPTRSTLRAHEVSAIGRPVAVECKTHILTKPIP
ncbi:zinc-dependent metalloproteinase lipoprotein [Porphyromonas bennonis]|uniref:zinc-dependent metalloproteinase lipoprotein n=1 Tax=Porphyromonas bennonis TaxID=501496 RepID=UPI00037F09CA|nr:zinc-dependent metalloproteinase lipoprotein [Porphyromonas bennonis]